jgi:uncharacterized protein
MSDIVIREWDASDAARSDRSASDRARHRRKVREAIRGNIAEIVAEEAIIGKSRERIVKVPIRGIREYRFSFGANQPRVGQGDGETEPGQILDREPSARPGDHAGDQPGFDYYETEITLDELVEIMFEDLELPLQERKNLREVPVESRRKLSGYRRKGAWARLSLRRSARERLRRLQKTRRRVRILESEIDLLRREAENRRLAGDFRGSARCLKRVEEHGRKLEQAREFAARFDTQPRDVTAPDRVRFPFREEDLRFQRPRVEPRYESNAVVLCIMDTSGSMHTAKKYLARSFFFLLHSFIAARYRNVHTVFIAHHMEAREVTEEEFFHKGESGGTFISSGYKKAIEIINERYHPSLWNIYAFHCSDGDNFDSDNDDAIRAAVELSGVCNLFGYGEIKPEGEGRYENSLLDFFSSHVDVPNFEAILIRKREDVWPAFRKLLRHESA